MQINHHLPAHLHTANHADHENLVKGLENISTDHRQPIYRLPSVSLIAKTFGSNLVVQASEIGLTPSTDWLQFAGSSSIALAKLILQQGVTRGVNKLHSYEITHNHMPAFKYSVLPNLNIRDRSIVGQMGQHAAVCMGSIVLTNALVGGVPLGLVAAGVGGALHGAIMTSLQWQEGIINDDLLSYHIPNRNMILARTITVNTLSAILSSMASGGLQGFLIAGAPGVIPGSLSCLARVFLDQGIEIPRSLISHYIEYQRGKESSEHKYQQESVLYFLPCELNLDGEIDLELEEASLIAESLHHGHAPWIGPM